MFPYESLLSHASFDKKNKRKEKEKNIKLSQTSFGHISTKSSKIPTVLKPA